MWWGRVYTCHGECVEARGPFCGDDARLPLYLGSRVSTSGCQICVASALIHGAILPVLQCMCFCVVGIKLIYFFTLISLFVMILSSGRPVSGVGVPPSFVLVLGVLAGLLSPVGCTVETFIVHLAFCFCLLLLEELVQKGERPVCSLVDAEDQNSGPCDVVFALYREASSKRVS